MIGDRLGKWVIFKELGRGGMGRVYLAQEELTGRQAAIKVLSSELAQEIGFLQRFQREIETLSKLDHPNIVRFYESGFDNGLYYYAMEYVEGQSLEQILDQQGRLDWRDVLYVALQVNSWAVFAEATGLLAVFPVLFLAFAYTQSFRLILYLVVVAVGTLVGLEIPLLMRILKDRYRFSELVAHVLTFDYLGALGASILFPLILVPKLGMVRSALLFGMTNAAVALWSTYLFRDQIGARGALRLACAAVLIALGAGMAGAERISAAADNNLYAFTSQ